MSQFSNRLPALRYHLASLSRFQFIKILARLSQSTAATHSGNSQMDSESNSSMEVVDVDKQDRQQQQQRQTAGKMSPTHDSDSDAEAVEQWHWRCQPIEAVQRGLQPYELDHLGPVHCGGGHKVLYRLPIREAANEPPRPQRSAHRWDADHVRLPCAVESKYPVEAEDGTSDIESRWGMIERALLRPISSSKQLQAAILSYNTTYKGQWNFRALHKLFEEELDESESRCFFEDLLPRIIRLALRLPELIQAPIPLLKQNQSRGLSLSQQQISCLLANAFLCTFPRRNTLKRKSEYSNFPDINFNRLYSTTGASVLEKLKCIFHYFRRVCPTERDASNVPTGCCTFVRLCDKPEDQVNWSKSGVTLASIPIHINASGTIEDQGIGLLQVDFANKFLGGGVLGHGAVQEEIRFVICPELIITKLFTECLRPTEALLMVGCERFSNYTGYACSFVWAGNHEDHTPFDTSRRRRTAIVAIDALSFSVGTTTHQYREDLMLRELNKATIGFKHSLGTPAPGVATGNWGCGAFGGDPHLKALIQMMVCAHHKRPLAYFTFGNCQLRDDLHVLWQLFRAHGTTVRQLWSIMLGYRKKAGERAFYAFVLDELRKLHNVKAQGAAVPGAVGGAKLKEAPPQAAATVKAPTTQQSPDIFADTSNGSLLSDEDVDDEEEQANAMMLAATLESGRSSSSSSSNSNAKGSRAGAGEPVGAAATQDAASNSPAHAASGGGSRQLTLLEMLDRHYEQGQPNGSKRQRKADCKEPEGSSGNSNTNNSSNNSSSNNNSNNCRH